MITVIVNDRMTDDVSTTIAKDVNGLVPSIIKILRVIEIDYQFEVNPAFHAAILTASTYALCFIAAPLPNAALSNRLPLSLARRP